MQSTRYFEVGSPISTTEQQPGLALYTLKAKAQGGSGFQVHVRMYTIFPNVSSRFHIAPVALTGGIMHAPHI